MPAVGCQLRGQGLRGAREGPATSPGWGWASGPKLASFLGQTGGPPSFCPQQGLEMVGAVRDRVPGSRGGQGGGLSLQASSVASLNPGRSRLWDGDAVPTWTSEPWTS